MKNGMHMEKRVHLVIYYALCSRNVSGRVETWEGKSEEIYRK